MLQDATVVNWEVLERIRYLTSNFRPPRGDERKFKRGIRHHGLRSGRHFDAGGQQHYAGGYQARESRFRCHLVARRSVSHDGFQPNLFDLHEMIQDLERRPRMRGLTKLQASGRHGSNAGKDLGFLAFKLLEPTV